MGLTEPGAAARLCMPGQHMDRQPHLPPLRTHLRLGVRMMSATVIDIRYARDVIDPLPAIIVTEHTLQFGTSLYTIHASVDAKGRGARFKIVDESGELILLRPGRPDPEVIDAAIIGWRAGIARGRAQMAEAMS